MAEREYTIVAPDGRELTIVGPDNATPAQLRSAAERAFAAPAKAAKDGKEQVSDSSLVAIGAGLGKGVGTVALNAQKLLGKGINLAAGDNAAGNWLVTDAEQGLRNLQAQAAPYKEASPFATGAGELGGEILATAPVGGLIARGVGGAVSTASPAAARAAAPLLEAIRTGGMRTGMAPSAASMATRMAGGAVAGGAAAGLVNPEDAGTGAVIGAALPPAISGIGKLGGAVGRGISAVVAPYTEAGRQRIAGNILQRMAQGGPTAINAAEIVPGSVPTLAEASGNAGLATLQRGLRDVNPNPFIEREAQNAAMRLAAFERVAGTADDMANAISKRSEASNKLYKEALSGSADENLTPWIKGQITQLLKRPAINIASQKAQKLAMERGEKPLAEGSMPALHDVKMILDEMINDAAVNGETSKVIAYSKTRDKFLTVLEKLSPKYKEARTTYAQMSQPINAMEALQNLKLTDAQGNITLSKVQSAIKSLESRAAASGRSEAKSVTTEQLGALKAIRDDLLRQSNLGLGRSIGSNTFQNIATDNILNSLLGEKITGAIGKTGLSGIAGQIGRVAYSGPNEQIRNRLIQLALNPRAADEAMAPVLQSQGNALTQAIGSYGAPVIYRAAPVISAQ